jgi:hypothetical protein
MRMCPERAGSTPAPCAGARTERLARTAGLRPPGATLVAGVDPPCGATSKPDLRPGVYSERCCGIPASSARTSVSRYRRCPPRVRMEVSFPALAHRVTVFGSTRNIVATSAGVSSGSASGVRADMLTASPPGPVLRSCVCCSGCPIWSTQTILPSPAVTSRPPGAKDFLVSFLAAPSIRVTLRDSSDTQRRNGQIRKSHPPSVV